MTSSESELREYVLDMARRAREASRSLALASRGQKDKALGLMSEGLRESRQYVLGENQKDLDLARKAAMPPALLDRLKLTESRITGMSKALSEIAALPDPVGEIIEGTVRPNGLVVERVRVAIGVVGFVYESRPNVTSDAAGLCLKSGNAVILRGGKEALHSNRAIADVLTKAVAEAGLPEDAIQVMATSDRRALDLLVGQQGLVDILIARGGEGLIGHLMEHSRVPVIKHYRGVCHTFVDASADLKMASDIAFNAKVQRPSVCNAMEALLVHEAVAGRFLPEIGERLRQAGVEIRACPRTLSILPWATPATEQDWGKEYLDLILAVRVVPSLGEAVDHISRYGSGHSDAICTRDLDNAEEFLHRVDSAAVFVNASTRFTDGGEFGMGAEIGISTDKLHVRGPMGLRELTSYKFVVRGHGQIRT